MSDKVTIKIETDITVTIGEVSVHLTREQAKALRDALDKELKGAAFDIEKFRETFFPKPTPLNPWPGLPYGPIDPYPWDYQRIGKPDWTYRPQFGPRYTLTSDKASLE